MKILANPSIDVSALKLKPRYDLTPAHTSPSPYVLAGYGATDNDLDVRYTIALQRFAQNHAGKALTLNDCAPITQDNLEFLLWHLQRKSFHCSYDRDFKRAYRRWYCAQCRQEKRTHDSGTLTPRPCGVEKCGTTYPKYYHYKSIGDKQYIKLTSKRYMAVIVTDIDVKGTSGGTLECLNPVIRLSIEQSLAAGYGANLIGINNTNGKAQLITYIDYAYSGRDKTSKSIIFAKAISDALNKKYGGDPAFSHGFSRNPFYTGNDQQYTWYHAHDNLAPLKGLAWHAKSLGAYELNKLPSTIKAEKKQRHSSGYELIEHAITNRTRSQEVAKQLRDLEDQGLFTYEQLRELEKNDPNVIEGVRIRYINNRVARDETAFRHALKITWLRKNRGEKLTDDGIISAYLYAYNRACRMDTTGRHPEIPPMRDLKTLARRIRGYVTHYKPTRTRTRAVKSSITGIEPLNAREKKALATLGARGGKTSAKRKWANPESELAQQAIQPLHKANQQRKAEGRVSARTIANYFDEALLYRGSYPTLKKAAKHFRVSTKTIQRALEDAQIRLPRGRRKKKN